MAATLSPTQRAFNADSNGKFDKPLREQLKFFREKVLLPTEHYNDLLKSAHDRAFVVAGVMKADLLSDIHQAIDKAIAEGKSIQWFRKEFENIVAKKGWGDAGSAAKRAWRARLIYRTNLSTSYAAGRWAQLNDPELLKRQPYWKYIHNDTVRHPRPLHQSWSGLVLPANHPWFLTHFPPNGWGCRCRVVAVPASEYSGQTAPNNGFSTVADRFGNTHQVPNGIDFGWDYAPGASRATPLKDIIDQKLIRLQASMGAELWRALKATVAEENRQAWATTLSTWIINPAARDSHFLLGALSPAVLAALIALKKPAARSAEIAVDGRTLFDTPEQDGGQKPLTPLEWAKLPALIDTAQAYYDNRTGMIVYVAPGGADQRIIITLGYRVQASETRLNTLAAGYREPARQVADRIERGEWVILQ